MIYWERNNPDIFYKKFGIRNLVNSLFWLLDNFL